jgi:hypothetical protein
VDLQTGCVVHSLECSISLSSESKRGCTHTPNTTQLLSGAGLKYLYVESMTNTMRGSRDTSQSSTNNSNLRSTKLLSGLWSIGGQELVQKPLNELVDEQERVKNWILHGETVAGMKSQLIQILREKKQGGLLILFILIERVLSIASGTVLYL